MAQDDLNSFLAVAEDLRVKGLTQGSGSADTASKQKSEPTKYPPVRSRESQMPSEPPTKKSRAAPPEVPSYDDDIQEVLPVKSEPGAAPTAGASHYDVSQDQNQVAHLEEQYDESYDYGQYGEAYDDGSGMIDPNTGLPLQTADGNKGESSFNLVLVRLCLALNVNDFLYFHDSQCLMSAQSWINPILYPGSFHSFRGPGRRISLDTNKLPWPSEISANIFYCKL